MRKIIAIVNGYPESGKDTACIYACTQFERYDWRAMFASSIEPAKLITDSAGIPREPKTPEKRALWADIKTAFEKYDRTLSRLCVQQAVEWLFEEEKDSIIFLHVREPEAIEFMQSITAEGIEFYKIFVDRPSSDREYSNEADRNVEGIAYDAVIKNQSTLKNLEMMCRGFAEYIHTMKPSA